MSILNKNDVQEGARKRRYTLEWARNRATKSIHTWSSRILDWEPDPLKHKCIQARPRRRRIDDINEMLVRRGVNTWRTALRDNAAGAGRGVPSVLDRLQGTTFELPAKDAEASTCCQLGGQPFSASNARLYLYL